MFMSQNENISARKDVPSETKASEIPEKTDPKQRALALGLEFSKRSLEAESMDELCFMLTNDLRLLIEFDRAILITHFDDKSELVAATNQPSISTKPKFHQTVSSLAKDLKLVKKAVFIAGDPDAALSDKDLPDQARDALVTYINVTECSFVLCVPLIHNKSLVGHLLFEFYENKAPDQIAILTILNIAPFFASALAEKWLIKRNPVLWDQVSGDAKTENLYKRLKSKPYAWVVLGLLFVVVVFVIPVTHVVGGESEIIPKEKHVAFPRIDGVLEKVFVKEGTAVEKGQVLALLDKRDLDHEIKSAENRFDILTKEMMLLRRESGQDPAKLAESKLVQLKRAAAAEELEYARWKSRFLEIKAPVSAVVITKDVESLVGKKLRAGEAFCEMAAPRDLWAAILVPEEKISFVAKGQPATVYLNSLPGKGFEVRVEEISPTAQAMPRLGNVYRVMAPFTAGESYAKVGMKGIGKIETGRSSIFGIIYLRLRTRWNYLSIHF
jgi:hypothetical protein